MPLNRPSTFPLPSAMPNAWCSIVLISLTIVYQLDVLVHAQNQGLYDPIFTRQDVDIDWYKLNASETITWTSCGSEQKCARVFLPLDYSRESVSPKATIALRMQPASSNVTYKGIVLYNPGGPGISGTMLVANIGPIIANLVGHGYDIVGFDVRGAGATLPLAQCFETEPQMQTFTQWTPILLNISDTSIPYSNAQQDVVAELCRRKLGGDGREDVHGTVEEWGGGRYMDTASVATDMLRINELLGQDKLNYLGISYGTVLGQYFAAMYPDKVGLFVMDAVCDAEYDSWYSVLSDTESAIDRLYSYCHQAGPHECPLYESDASRIKARVWSIMDSNTPLAGPFAAQGPAVITKALLQQQLITAASTPITGWPQLADILTAVERNNQSALASSNIIAASVPLCNSTNEPVPWFRENSAEQAIRCLDYPIPDVSATFNAYLSDLLEVSPIAAPVWAQRHLQCMKWPFQAKNRFTGPFTGNTSSPILLLSNILDPQCPLAQARRVHERLPGSRLLVQNATGHVATLTPSACTFAAVQAYFADGTLPAADVLCQPDVLPFIGAAGSP
ncbi:hypothetical protein PLICRDRAFT_178957 [Plicaturopsis crispa FD-325 SS-3]|uniref:Alpha/beta-hydrolase n=1 Tax=Plicaturopsis crispa FD-325 SS-3 TaxID=944288 RepID=A0A0C9TAC1_PLICR|nr:hypothetical protein PLICRDRAFT_178957 [Plicaturopsis crispa FD-325 SS-3]